MDNKEDFVQLDYKLVAEKRNILKTVFDDVVREGVTLNIERVDEFHFFVRLSFTLNGLTHRAGKQLFITYIERLYAKFVIQMLVMKLAKQVFLKQ